MQTCSPWQYMPQTFDDLFADQAWRSKATAQRDPPFRPRVALSPVSLFAAQHQSANSSNEPNLSPTLTPSRSLPPDLNHNRDITAQPKACLYPKP